MQYAYCPAWPQERKDAEARLYRAACRLRCLESSLDRTDPEDFDDLMVQIEKAVEEVSAAGQECTKLRGKS